MHSEKCTLSRLRRLPAGRGRSGLAEASSTGALLAEARRFRTVADDALDSAPPHEIAPAANWPSNGTAPTGVNVGCWAPPQRGR